MREEEWVEIVAEELRKKLPLGRGKLDVKTGLRIAYGCEIGTYPDSKKDTPSIKASLFQTDLAIVEKVEDGWKPRVIVEAKLSRISTHDSITYSHKANIHRAVHPYLRYGIMLGARGSYSLPGRLYRHGGQFDFMISFKGHKMTRDELRSMVKLLSEEIKASRALEKLFYENRNRDRDRYTLLQRKLVLK